jgi:uncharacterized protein
MMLKDQVNSDIKQAMRAKDKKTLDALRLILAAIKQIEVDERIEVDDDRMLIILNKLAKQRNESITQFRSANRLDLVSQEEFELSLITQYLPEPLSEADVEHYIQQAISELNASKMSDMGAVMTHLKPHLQGRTDMSRVSLLIKKRLS